MDQNLNNINLQSILLVMSIIFTLAIFMIFFFTVYQKRLLQQQKAHQEVEAKYQKRLLKAAIDSQEQERNRIAKELHDDIGAMLTTSKLYASQLSPQLSKDELLSVKQKTLQLFDEMIQSSRRISQDLRPVVLEKLGLIEGIQNLVHTVNETGQILVSFNHEELNITDKSLIINLYRIIQELISNTIKHAEASKIDINLKKQSKTLLLQYHDNGKGINFEQLRLNKGLGMMNVESRVSALDGLLRYQPIVKGIKLLIEVPLMEHKKNN